MKSEQQHSVLGEQVELLYKNLPIGLAGTLINAGILAVMVQGSTAKGVALSWFVAHCVISLLRYLSYRVYLRERYSKDVQTWWNVYLMGITGSALLWGCASVMLYAHDSVVHQIFLAFVIAGMAAGAVASTAPVFTAYAIYNLFLLLPLTVQLFLGGDELHLAMGFMVLLFMGITSSAAWRFYRTTYESLRLRFANEALVEKLSAEQGRVLEALKEAEEANRSKDMFLANMSHEIRTPLNGVIGFAQLLCKTELDDRQEKYVSTIENSSKTLLGILNDILDFSKIQTGKVTLEQTGFSLRRELEPVLSLFETLADEKSIDYRIELDPALPECVMGDPLRIKQILSNLISNAIKFTPPKGMVRVVLSAQETGREKVKLSFSVHDTGEGIKAENISKIFEPFAQEDSSISRRFGGTGLGLSICRDFIRMMGSELQVESAPQKGSTFMFDIEFERCQQEESVALPLEAEKSKGVQKEGKILIVEDNLTNQMLVEIMLEEELGYESEIANNGREALQKFEEGRAYLLVLMDVNMPEMDGVEATRQIRRFEAEHHKAATPIIALSANVFKQDQERYIAAGMNDVLSKPVMLDLLKETLNRYIG